LVVVPPLVSAGVVVTGGVAPPVPSGVVVAGGVTAVPPELDEELGVEELELGVVEVVVVVAVVDVEADAEAAGVPPEGGAVRAGGSVGTL
jgi:hypothetical protein